MKKDIVAVILAAGSGKRFWPFTTNKNLWPIFGKTFFDFAIGETLPKEVADVIIVANTENQKQLAETKLGVQQTVVLQKEGDGMADAVRAARDRIRGKRILVIIADDISNKDIFRSVLDRSNDGTFGVMTAYHTKTHVQGGYVRFQGERPVGIVEKPAEGKEPSAFVYFGGQYFADGDVLLAALNGVTTSQDDVYEHALSELMKSRDFTVVPQEDPFVSLKYPWHVLDVTDYLLHHRMKAGQGKHVEIQNNVVIEGPVYLGNNVRIFENTKIVGPVYIGDNTIIGNNNMIRDSYVGADCVTGFNTDITRSYIGDHCWFHSNYVGDSVLEGNVSMGSGSVLANLRLDEGEISSVVRNERINTHRTKLGAMIAANVRIGVNVSIMPGVKIGTEIMIGAGVTLDNDLPDHSFCIAKHAYEVKKNTASVTKPVARASFRSKL
jgi:bifunctional UDP-N-acetylglucosamine pyrophosphorylase/glucosamine-1-phosphate N-acetyltransferase